MSLDRTLPKAFLDHYSTTDPVFMWLIEEWNIQSKLNKKIGNSEKKEEKNSANDMIKKLPSNSITMLIEEAEASTNLIIRTKIRTLAIIKQHYQEKGETAPNQITDLDKKIQKFEELIVRPSPGEESPVRRYTLHQSILRLSTVIEDARPLEQLTEARNSYPNVEKPRVRSRQNAMDDSPVSVIGESAAGLRTEGSVMSVAMQVESAAYQPTTSEQGDNVQTSFGQTDQKYT